MWFSEEQLDQLRASYLEVRCKSQELVESYLTRNYRDPRAREYAAYGFSRRMQILVRCIENTFRILPPDRVQLPEFEELADAVISIQAFVFNVFASVDNVAWIWVSERGMKLDKRRVGLGKEKKEVRNSLSPEFQEYLRGLDAWFDYLIGFRDALAHRIPLYIPPYVVPDDKRAEYDELEHQMQATRDSQEYERLSATQKALVVFRPFMTHSFEENARIVVFHERLLADFNTVEELGWKMLEELDASLPPKVSS